MQLFYFKSGLTKNPPHKPIDQSKIRDNLQDAWLKDLLSKVNNFISLNFKHKDMRSSHAPQNHLASLNNCQYLLSSQVNYTLTNYAEHVSNVSHDLIKLYLEREKLTAKGVWNQVKTDIVPDEGGYIVFDDTVLDKNHSRQIESVRWQYSGNAHQIIRGIGLVNCIYVNP